MTSTVGQGPGTRQYTFNTRNLPGDPTVLLVTSISQQSLPTAIAFAVGLCSSSCDPASFFRGKLGELMAAAIPVQVTAPETPGM
jgi:hypothetical protein